MEWLAGSVLTPALLAGCLIHFGLMRSTRKGFALRATAPVSPLR